MKKKKWKETKVNVKNEIFALLINAIYFKLRIIIKEYQRKNKIINLIKNFNKIYVLKKI